jgi:CDP-glycerol glycerophosphotransferase (TagB/SpsB family)
MLSVLFTGYAPVHYACFRPLHEALEREPGIEVRVAGGTRTKLDLGTYAYDPKAMFGPFGVDDDAVLTVDEIAELDVDVLFCANTKAIRPRSAQRTIEIFHGMSFRNLAVREENSGKDAYFVLGPYMRRAFAERGLLPPGDPRAVEIGFPKTDRLLDGSLDREALLAAAGLSGERPVLLYAPTGAKHNSLETMGEEVLGHLKASGQFDVLVKLHDHPRNAIDWRARLAPLEDAHLRIARSPDVIESLFVADALISDASSVSNEYALLDRPMAFLDVPRLIEHARSREGSALDLETWGRRAGPVVEEPTQVVDAVAGELEHPERHSAVRRGIAEDLFYNPGRATEAAVRWLREALVPA